HLIGIGDIAALGGQKGLLLVEQGPIGIEEPPGGQGFAHGEVQAIGFALQDVLLELHQGLQVIVLKDQIGYIAAVVPVIEVKEILPVQTVVQVEIVAETGLQPGVALLVIAFVEKEAERIEVIVVGPFDAPAIVKGKTVLVGRGIKQ